MQQKVSENFRGGVFPDQVTFDNIIHNECPGRSKNDDVISNAPVLGYVKTKSGTAVPLLDIKMMSDERWQQLAEEGAIKNFTRNNGYPPENAQQAYEWQREWVKSLIGEDEKARASA